MTRILTHCKYNRKNGSGKVDFNARFDDVMLIVKREMASVLGGPLPATLCIFAMSTSSTLSLRSNNTGTTRRGKLNISPIYLLTTPKV